QDGLIRDAAGVSGVGERAIRTDLQAEEAVAARGAQTASVREVRADRLAGVANPPGTASQRRGPEQQHAPEPSTPLPQLSRADGELQGKEEEEGVETWWPRPNGAERPRSRESPDHEPQGRRKP